MKYMGFEVLQALKTKNAIKRANPNRLLEFHLRNINVNGQKRGCSGHILDIDTGVCVYINTERSVQVPHDMLYREAKGVGDFSSLGILNNFASTLEELVEGVSRLLDVPVRKKAEKEEAVAKKQTKKAEVKEESMAKNTVKFEKAKVWVAPTKDTVEERDGYRFADKIGEVELYVGLVKENGGWVMVDTYTGTSLGGLTYSTRDKAARHYFDTVKAAYEKVFMTEMHEAKASDFSKKCLHAKGVETKGEQMKRQEKELAKKAEAAAKAKPKRKRTVKKQEPVPVPETVETTAVETLSFIDGDAESAEKVIEALRELMKDGNVVVRWKGKPMAPIRVEGDTKPYQEALKERGLRWARKGFWYLKPTMA